MLVKLMFALLALFLAAEGSSLVGAPISADMNETEVQDALQFAVVQHNRASNDMWTSQVTKVIRVQKQVVAGLKYIFTVEMARTSCKKGGVLEKCEVHSDPSIAKPHECRLAVWSRPWLGKTEVVENTCK
ncbi:cystatin-like [Hoplias malabaricus]|uniref:cystatin-like n=1 Tax=Hoplias malabaricus TaxID=27720 RepID=UPI0034622054